MLHNDIGDKIKRLRLSQKMTQAELAGDQITRNMLSRIENGAALPSLPTVWYLAERLKVPAGFLLAEGDDDRIWRKMNEISNIKRVFSRGDARICLELCRSWAADADDEIYHIMAQCSLKIAQEELDAGRLHAACDALNDVVTYAEKTAYSTQGLLQTTALFFRFLRQLSPTLYSANPLDIEDAFLGSSHPFGRYILAREALEAADRRRVEAYLSETEAQTPWKQHLLAHCMMVDGDYVPARDLLLRLLHSENASSRVLVYCLFCDLEICCRETGDFKGAYEYSRDKVLLLERMLEQ